MTCLAFADGCTRLVSSSKDTFLKVWDLALQHCVQTVVGHRSEVWSFDLDEGSGRLVTGAGDNQLRMFRLDGTRSLVAGAGDDGAPGADAVAGGGEEEAGGGGGAVAVPAAAAAGLLDASEVAGLRALSSGDIVPMGAVARRATDRAVTVLFSPDKRYVAVHVRCLPPPPLTASRHPGIHHKYIIFVCVRWRVLTRAATGRGEVAGGVPCAHARGGAALDRAAAAARAREGEAEEREGGGRGRGRGRGRW